MLPLPTSFPFKLPLSTFFPSVDLRDSSSGRRSNLNSSQRDSCDRSGPKRAAACGAGRPFLPHYVESSRFPSPNRHVSAHRRGLRHRRAPVQCQARLPGVRAAPFAFERRAVEALPFHFSYLLHSALHPLSFRHLTSLFDRSELEERPLLRSYDNQRMKEKPSTTGDDFDDWRWEGTGEGYCRPSACA